MKKYGFSFMKRAYSLILQMLKFKYKNDIKMGPAFCGHLVLDIYYYLLFTSRLKKSRSRDCMHMHPLTLY